jgi:hypothetical protein
MPSVDVSNIRNVIGSDSPRLLRMKRLNGRLSEFITITSSQITRLRNIDEKMD